MHVCPQEIAALLLAVPALLAARAWLYERLARLAQRMRPRDCGTLGKDGKPCERHAGHSDDTHVSATRVWAKSTRWKDGKRICPRCRTMADTLRRAQVRGTELLERARAAEAKITRAADIARRTATKMHGGFIARHQVEQVLIELADLEGKR